jgi:hypothetical protein
MVMMISAASSALAAEEGERTEEGGIDEIADAVQEQLRRGAGDAARQARAPLVIIERVKGAERALRDEEPERGDHARASGVTVPVYATSRPARGA